MTEGFTGHHPIPIPNAALAAVLSFLPFPELQSKAFTSRQTSTVIVRRAKAVIEKAETGRNYLRFVDWRCDTGLQVLRRERDAALARHAAYRTRRQFIEGEEDALSAAAELIDTVQGKRENIAQRKVLIRVMRFLVEASKHELDTVEKATSKIEAIIDWRKAERGRVNLRGGERGESRCKMATISSCDFVTVRCSITSEVGD